LKKILFIIVLLFAIATPVEYFAQEGGKKREKKTGRRGDFHLDRWRSQGHADKFARGSSGRRNIFSKLFKKDKPAWRYRVTGSPRSNFRDNQFLFTRTRTKGKMENANIQSKQNMHRARNRVRGNDVFKRKKYKR
jgi:Ni/Co efflux regulator RcnB